jgi:Kef-type K+ transport system membrane component KefB
MCFRLLGDRGDLTQPRGQKIVAILLFEDLLIVPLLAIALAAANSLNNGLSNQYPAAISPAIASKPIPIFSNWVIGGI